MPPAASLLLSIAAFVISVVCGTTLYLNLVNERNYLRARLEQALQRNEDLQKRVVDLGGEVHFVDGALNEARLDDR